MWTLAIKNLRANLSRFVATLIAITAGVGFLTAGTMVTNSIENSLGGEIDRQYAAVSTAVEQANGGSDDEGFGSGGIDIDELDRVQGIDGVRAAVGEVTGFAKIVGSDDDRGGLFGGGGTVVQGWHDDAELNGLDIAEGRAPDGEGEITVDRGTAEDNDISVGDEIELGTASGATKVTVVGLTTFGTTDSANPNGTITATEPWVFDLITNGDPGYVRLLVAGDGSVDDATLTTRIARQLDDSLTAVTGSEFRTEAKGDLATVFDLLRPVLQGFAGLALFVCAFVIYNTFNVIVGQRIRELALMRAVAATPRQIRRSLRVEGLGIGLLGSVLGLGMGALLTYILSQVLVALDLDLPEAQIVMTPAIVITGVLAGTLTTLISVLIPAYRAGRTAPVEAMRDAAVEQTRVGKVRLGFAAVLLAGGVGLMVTKNGWLVGPGALFFVIGVLLLGPAIASSFARATRPLLKLLGVAGRLSSDNIARNPKRTSTTMNALVIGLLLVTLVTVAGTTLKQTAIDETAKYAASDYIVLAMPGSSIDDGFFRKADAIDGIESLTPMRRLDLDGDNSISTASPEALRSLDLKVLEGSIDDLGNGVAVTSDPDGESYHVGDIRYFVDDEGKSFSLPVTVVLEFTVDSAFFGGLVSEQTMEQLSPGQVVNTALVTADDDQQEAVGDALNKAAESYGNVFIFEGNIIGEVIETVFNFLINAVNGLLGMSIVMALIGIVNTLTLSVFERRRELGLLRAVGMTVQSVRRMVRLEALQMAMLGTLIGMISGTILGWLLIRATDLAELTIPWGRLGILFGVGVLLGVLAAIAPTRRVTKLNVLEAITVT